MIERLLQGVRDKNVYLVSQTMATRELGVRIRHSVGVHRYKLDQFQMEIITRLD